MNNSTAQLATFDAAVAQTPPFSTSSAARPSNADEDPEHPIRTFVLLSLRVSSEDQDVMRR